MLRVLIDEHPAWSTINGADWSLAPGFASIEERTSDKPHRPECYCHGERSDTNEHINQKNSVAMGCEYAYVFAKDRPIMYVLSSYNPDGIKMIGMFGCGNPKAIWKCIAEVDLEGSEPQWDKMTE
jgi:hypothetical protein